MSKDLSAILPDGQSFDFWEVPQEFSRTLYVDGSSRNGWFDILLDEETRKIRFREAGDSLRGHPVQLAMLDLIRRPEDVPGVTPDPLVASDFSGRPHPAGSVLPGPFSSLEDTGLDFAD